MDARALGYTVIDSAEDYRAWLKDRPKPFVEKGVKFHALNAILVSRAMVVPNDYNPNHVASDKMKLLQTSIVDNGFCFGVVMIWDAEVEKFVIIDGDHRNRISGEDWLKLTYVPAVILDHDMSKRLSATVQFNKARGVHKIDLNAELVKRMVELGVPEADICKRLGMDADEVLRLKRNVKIADVYKDLQYSRAWEVNEEAATTGI
jgi:ParB-like chromosome segregation protein Spo0J